MASAADHYEVLVFDTSKKDALSSLTEPSWTINTRTIMRGSKIRISATIPPIAQVTATNNTIVTNTGFPDAVSGTIDAGFYDNATDVVDSFNTAFAATTVAFSLDPRTAKVTATAGGVFTISGAELLGISGSVGSATYTGSNVCQVGENSIMLCSNMETLLYHHSDAARREAFLPDTLLLASTLPVVSAYYHVRSEWITVINQQTFQDISFFWANPSTPDVPTSISHPWSIILELSR